MLLFIRSREENYWLARHSKVLRLLSRPLGWKVIGVV